MLQSSKDVKYLLCKLMNKLHSLTSAIYIQRQCTKLMQYNQTLFQYRWSSQWYCAVVTHYLRTGMKSLPVLFIIKSHGKYVINCICNNVVIHNYVDI